MLTPPLTRCLLPLLLVGPTMADEADHRLVEFSRDGVRSTVEGSVLAEDQQGGLCLQVIDGALVLVQGEEVLNSRELTQPFEPVDSEAMSKLLLAELGEGYRTHTTPHYLVAYSTSREFAKWLSSLLERLHRAFVNHWSRQGIELHEPEFPLPVIVHADQAAYLRAAGAELGGGPGVVGYYSLKTNRVCMYDLTGAERLRSRQGGRTSLKDINRMLLRPEATPLVSTIVHEATHQVAFNTGLMQRYADLPLWLVEGMAIYFEAPDLSSNRRWQGIGKVNYPRLGVFRANLSDWNDSRLHDLLTDDQILRQASTAPQAYADAWALNYFLIKQRPKQYRSYLKALSQKAPFQPPPQASRLEEFEAHFGPLGPLNAAFLRLMTRVD